MHLGSPPAPTFRVAEVLAPVAEPGIDVAVLNAFESRLSLSPPADSERTALKLLVERADWTPSRRDGAVLIYSARLRVRASTPAAARSCDLAADVLSPSEAELAPAARASAFGSLAERCAAELVAWLVLSSPASQPDSSVPAVPSNADPLPPG